MGLLLGPSSGLPRCWQVTCRTQVGSCLPQSGAVTKNTVPVTKNTALAHRPGGVCIGSDSGAMAQDDARQLSRSAAPAVPVCTGSTGAVLPSSRARAWARALSPNAQPRFPAARSGVQGRLLPGGKGRPGINKAATHRGLKVQMPECICGV